MSAIKNAFLVVCLILFAKMNGIAQNSFPSTGNVAIGTNTPDQPLTINAPTGSNSVVSFKQNATTAAYIGLGMDGVFRNETLSGTQLQLRANGANNFISLHTNGMERTRITSAGNIGIGTIAPTATLHVSALNQSAGDDAVLFEKPRTATNAAFRYTFANVGGTTNDPGAGFWRGFHLAAPHITVNGANTFPRLAFYSEYNSLTDPSMRKWVIHAGNSTVAHDIQFMHDNTELLYLKSTGNVGIGTSNPQAKLAVNGDIFSKKVKVTQTGWPDYVFEKGYQLPSLAEVEKYIQQHKHLPDVPSAAEVEKSGLDLGDNQAVVLKKIEELTLYAIEQNKRLDQLQEENKLLKTEMQFIRKTIKN